MDDALRVGCLQSISNLNRHIEQSFGLKGFPGISVLERLPFQKFHGDERPTFVLVDVVNGADIG